MPIYDRGYRTFDGQVRRHFRWWIMVSQEWQIIRRSRLFWVLTAIPIFYTLVVAVYIYIIDLIAVNQQHPWADVAQQLPISQIDNDVFFNFIRLQGPFVFLISILVGAGLIANDFRYHLVDIYFSKPLSWVDYVLGKTMTLVLIGLSLTAFPALGLMALHTVFVPTWQTVKEMSALIPPTLLFSLAFVLPSALAVLASSSFFNSTRFSAIAVFMVLIVNSVFGNVLPQLLREEPLHVLAFPVAVNRLGEEVFRQPNLAMDVSWQWSLVFVTAVCAAALAVVCLKVRRAGAAA